MMDLAVVDTTLVTMRGDRLGIVDDGAVGVKNGEIVYVGPTGDLEADPDETIDGSNRLTMPGLVDAHVHMGHTVLRGGAQDVPEIEWMTHALGPLARYTDEDDWAAGARLGVLEAVRSGVTTFGAYTADVAHLVEEAYRPFGVRVAATETITAVVDDQDERGPGEPYAFDHEKGEAALARAEALFDEYADDDLIRPMYGPQALDMVPPELLETIRDRANEHERDLHVHVAQGRRERLQIQARYGEDESTVSVLDDLGVLGERLIAVHCHDATPAERERLAEAGARFIGNPSSIAAIDGITPPIVEMREYGAPTGIGTDQAPGPGAHDMLAELRTACLLSKTDRQDPTALPAWEAIQVGTLGGATALGMPEVGVLEEGTPADLITIDLDRPGIAPTVTQPMHTAIPNVVYGESGGAVSNVVVDGERVVRDRDVVGVDEEAIIAEANERAKRAFERGTDDWQAAGSELVDAVDDGWL